MTAPTARDWIRQVAQRHGYDFTDAPTADTFRRGPTVIVVRYGKQPGPFEVIVNGDPIRRRVQKAAIHALINTT